MLSRLITARRTPGANLHVFTIVELNEISIDVVAAAFPSVYGRIGRVFLPRQIYLTTFC